MLRQAMRKCGIAVLRDRVTPHAHIQTRQRPGLPALARRRLSTDAACTAHVRRCLGSRRRDRPRRGGDGCRRPPIRSGLPCGTNCPGAHHPRTGSFGAAPLLSRRRGLEVAGKAYRRRPRPGRALPQGRGRHLDNSGFRAGESRPRPRGGYRLRPSRRSTLGRGAPDRSLRHPGRVYCGPHPVGARRPFPRRLITGGAGAPPRQPRVVLPPCGLRSASTG